MIFIEWIEALDIQLLLLINGLSSPFLDNGMWTFSSKLFGVPFYLIFIYILFKNKPFRSAITCTFLLVLVVVLSDLTAKYCFKEVFQRFRQSHNLILKDQLTFLNKPDGTFRKNLDISRIKSIGWEPKINLDEGISMEIKNIEDALNNKSDKGESLKNFF